MKLTKFCYVCKQHFTFEGKDKQEAQNRFYALGHDDRKTNKMAKGLSGKLPEGTVE